MGHMRMHTIVVSTWESGHIKAAHAKASEIFDWVSPICPMKTNGYRAFFIPPDGSKEGWDESDTGNENRTAFISWMRGTDLYLDWVEVQYGDDSDMTEICRHSDDDWTPLEEETLW